MKFKNLNNFITNIPGNYLAEMAQKNVAFVGNCKDLYTYFQKINKNCKYFSITKQNWKSVVKSLTQKDKNNMPKFDVIVGNPPYEGKGNPLYLQILEKVNVNNNRVIWLCPTQWVKNYKDSNYLDNLKKNTCNNLVFHTFIGNPFDGALTANEVGVFVFGEGNKENYETIRMERFLNAKLAKSIWDKFNVWNEKFGNIDDHNKIDLKKKYYVRAQWIRGNQDLKTNKPKWDWTTLFGEDQRTDFSFKPAETKSSPVSFWNFATVKECKNFVSACETDILMFAHYISKINNANNNQVLAMIPWLCDYTHEWTEAEIANKLNLTKEEVEYIHQEMANFGWKAAPRKKETVVKTNVKSNVDEQIKKINAKAMVMRKTFTAKQDKMYHKMFDAEWAKINKRIELSHKQERSLAFAKARVTCAKKVLM